MQSRCDRAHPLDILISKTARSYASAAHMLGAIGTPYFTSYPMEPYGRPNDIYKNQDWTAADFFLSKTDVTIDSATLCPLFICFVCFIASCFNCFFRFN